MLFAQASHIHPYLQCLHKPHIFTHIYNVCTSLTYSPILTMFTQASHIHPYLQCCTSLTYSPILTMLDKPHIFTHTYNVCTSLTCSPILTAMLHKPNIFTHTYNVAQAWHIHPYLQCCTSENCSQGSAKSFVPVSCAMWSCRWPNASFYDSSAFCSKEVVSIDFEIDFEAKKCPASNCLYCVSIAQWSQHRYVEYICMVWS